MRLQIRECVTEDAPRLLAIQQAAFARLQGFQMRQWQLHEFVQVLNQARGWAGCDARGEIVVYLLFQDLFEAWEILHLASAPRVWGQGLMTQLIEFCIAKRPPTKSLWLEVHEKNQRAIDLYERLGFQRGGRRPRFYGDGGAAILYTYL